MKTPFLSTALSSRSTFTIKCIIIIGVGSIAALLPLILGGIPGFTAPALVSEPLRIFLLAVGIPLMGAWFGIARILGWMKDPDEPTWAEEVGRAFLPSVCRTIFFCFSVVTSFVCFLMFLGVILPDGLVGLSFVAALVGAAGVVGIFNQFGWTLSGGWVEIGPSEVPWNRVFAWISTLVVAVIAAGPELLVLVRGSDEPKYLLGCAAARIIGAFAIGGIFGGGSHGKINGIALAAGIVSCIFVSAG